jgi:hypothetical protein
MKRLVASSLIILGSASVGLSEELLREISWAEREKTGQLPSGEVVSGQPPAPTEQLRIENREDSPKSVTLLVLDNPGITQRQYAVTGQIRCEGVRGKSYLEMWSHFPDGGRHFTRALARSGLLQSLEGSCPWRPFSLPFSVAPGAGLPTTLVVNLKFVGRGTVYLSPLRLVQYDDREDPWAIRGQWWDDQTAGAVGGILGTVLGCLGGLIGSLSVRGKARQLVLGLVGTVCALGVVCLGAGAVALGCRQPYAVWFPLLLMGVLGTALMGGMLPSVRRRYQQVELRKMEAADAVADTMVPRDAPS